MENINNSSKLDELIDVLESYTQFLEPYRFLLNTHNVQFLVDNLWQNETYIDKQLRTDLESHINECNETKTPVNLVKSFVNRAQSTTDDDQNKNKSSLDNLFVKLHEFNHLWTKKVITPPDILIQSDQTELIEFNESVNKKFEVMVKQNRFMNPKKVYEVDEMSKFVSKLCKKLGIHTIVDIGSGKAYLSAQLSSAVFENLFNVIAIDSSANYVESSVKRLSLMKRRTTIFCIKKGAKLEESDMKEENMNEEEKKHLVVDQYGKLVYDPTKFQTFAQFIQSSTELNNLIKQKLNTDNELDEKFGLIGLHSCGNLSNSIINLFLSNKEKTAIGNEDKSRLLCNVACCYNLLNEKYATDLESFIDVKKTNVKIDDSSKFPMSDYLNEKKYAINFNARSLACHSLDRCIKSIEDYRELNNDILWYRVVLQDILIDNYKEHFSKENTDEFNNMTIKIGRKFITNEKAMPTFVEYARKALERLELNGDLITDEQINSYFVKHENRKHTFDAYVQLKLLISPVIEYVILLDRLIYLYEKKSTDTSNFKHYLVKLFDPALSPRCHALISFVE